MKHGLLLLVTIFLPLVARADWQWENDLTTATLAPNQYRAQFKFENKGKGPLTVSEVVFSCPCVVSHFQAATVLPGKTGVLTIFIERQDDDEKAGRDLDLMVVGPASVTSHEMTIRIPE